MNHSRLAIIFLLGLLSVWDGLPNLVQCQHNYPFYETHLVAKQYNSPVLHGHHSHRATAISRSSHEGEKHCPTNTHNPLSCSTVLFRSVLQLKLALQSSSQATHYLGAALSSFFPPATRHSLPLPKKVPPDSIQLAAFRTVALLI